MIPPIAEIEENFALLPDWDDRYRYLIELGRTLPAFPDAWRTAPNRVSGCVSQVWIMRQTEWRGGKATLVFKADSDAMIVKGLIAVILAICEGLSAEEICHTDIDGMIGTLGLDTHLSPQRANGLRGMIARIRAEAAAGTEAEDVSGSGSGSDSGGSFSDPGLSGARSR